MRHTTDTFEGAGGLPIFWQAWRPDGEPRAHLTLAHGVSEHSGRYAHVAEALAAAGVATFALDHRGHGRTGTGAMVDRMDNAVSDLDTLVGLAAVEAAGRPVFLLGHSMGGCIALAYTTRGGGESLSGLILSGPAAVLESASPVTRLLARGLSAVVPGLGVFEIDSAAVSRDPVVVADYDSDPLNHHGRLPARTVAEMAAAIERFPGDLPALELPLLLLHGTADTLVPLAASELVEARAGSADKTLIRYEGLYHELVNEPERERVIGDIIAWLDARI